MDNASIHKSQHLRRKIESRGHRLIFLLPYSPELNPIEQFWAIVKEYLKHYRMLIEENLSSRIADACNQALIKGSKLISAIFHLPFLIAAITIRDRNRFTMKDMSYTDNLDLLDMSRRTLPEEHPVLHTLE